MRSWQDEEEDEDEALDAEGEHDAEYDDDAEYEDEYDDDSAEYDPEDGPGDEYSAEEAAAAREQRRADRRRATLLTGSALGLAALTGGAVWALFHSGNSISVAVPQVTSKAAQAQCAALTKAVPQTVDNESRRSTKPSSPLTAAWGDPAITLRCGVPEPQILRPGSKTYDPTADEAYLNGIAWLIEKTGGGYRFTAAQRAVYIEVDVPSAYTPETSPLIDLSASVLKAVPRNDGHPGDDIAPLPSQVATPTVTPGTPSTGTSATPTP